MNFLPGQDIDICNDAEFNCRGTDRCKIFARVLNDPDVHKHLLVRAGLTVTIIVHDFQIENEFC